MLTQKRKEQQKRVFLLVFSPETANEVWFITETLSTSLNSCSLGLKGRKRIAIIIWDF